MGDLELSNIDNAKWNSSIEMVRIIAMMFIIIGHLVGHGILKVTTTDSFEMCLGATLNKLFAILLIQGGRVGAALFFYE